MSIQSMTGYADAEGADDARAWRWEIRSVNARGLDLRLRVAEGFEKLEPAIRERVKAALSRGAVTVGLRLRRAAEAGSLALNEAALDQAVLAAATARRRAEAAGLACAPVAPEGLLALRGVLEPAEQDQAGADEEATARLLADFERALAALRAMREEEGARLAGIVGGQIDEIERLTASAREAAAEQAEAAPARLRERVEALLAAGAPADEDRLAQELALLAVKGDISEELDRLEAHVAAARALLAGDGPAGRRLDFLAQEFNREANTLCSKSGTALLTECGLALKVVIDRMREQVQNIE